jgi:hypothetical protein
MLFGQLRAAKSSAPSAPVDPLENDWAFADTIRAKKNAPKSAIFIMLESLPIYSEM